MKADILIDDITERRIRDLSESVNGPFYIYDKNIILRNCNKFLAIPYEPKSIHFAMMANSNPEFLKIVKEAGMNVFVNSVMHLEAALQLGYSGQEIVFAASAMDSQTMQKVRLCGANLILDSIGQYKQWLSLFPGKKIGIRCNIGDIEVAKNTTGGYFIGNESRLGFTMEAINSIKGDPNIKGLHIYVGTNITDINYFLNCYHHITDLAAYFPELEYIDFGGGFGMGEKDFIEFDTITYGKKVTELMKQVSAKLSRNIQLILEPGRIIGIDTAYFVCKVVDIKHQNSHQLIGVNASSVQFPRPLFYPGNAYHPVNILSKNGSSNNRPGVNSSIYGCSTYSRDYLARDVELHNTSVGDIIVLGHAGSYCATAYTRFLGFPNAEEYFS